MSPDFTRAFLVSVHIMPSPARQMIDSSYRCRCGSALLSEVLADELRGRRQSRQPCCPPASGTSVRPWRGVGRRRPRTTRSRRGRIKLGLGHTSGSSAAPRPAGPRPALTVEDRSLDRRQAEPLASAHIDAVGRRGGVGSFVRRSRRKRSPRPRSDELGSRPRRPTLTIGEAPPCDLQVELRLNCTDPCACEMIRTVTSGRPRRPGVARPAPARRRSSRCRAWRARRGPLQPRG